MVVKKHYESTFIVTPELETGVYAQIVEKFNNLMASSGAEIISQEIWGFRKLAYEIKKKQTGYYVYTEFDAPGDFIEKLEREYQYDERLMRYLTVSLDKDAFAYNAKRRARKNGETFKDENVEAGQ